MKLRFSWIKYYQEIGNFGKTCDHFGISRPTIRKWLKRYNLLGVEGLKDLKSIPKKFHLQKVWYKEEKIILDLRKKRKLGARRIQNELIRIHDLKLSLDTIHRVLKKNNVPNLVKKRHYRKTPKLYNLEVPGQRVQMDVCKITNDLYQYTAIDDCTRYKILNIYPRKTANCTVNFITMVIKEMPFPIQRLQTDRGKEFFAYEVQELMQKNKIKFRPIKPRSPHLNGKVERSQRTDLDEFYSDTDPKKDPNLETKLKEWQNHYNNKRPHTSLNGKTPSEQLNDKKNLIPTISKIHKNYDQSKERIRVQNYKYDLDLTKIYNKINAKKELKN